MPTLVTAEEPENHEIIVIGAGMAGISAANKLNEYGHDDVVVLESRDRIGGRMLTDNSYKDYHLDVGASWIHGIKDNPLAELAKEYGIKTVPFDDEDSLIIYDETGMPIGEDRKKSMRELYRQFEDFYHDYRANIIKHNGKDVSLQKVIDEFIATKKLTEQELNDFNFMIVWWIEGDYAADVSRISLLSFEDMGYKMESREVVFPEGYTQIINGLAKGLDIRLQHTVTEIDYTDTNIIHIKTDKGNFDAKYVINTLPLGVLKKNGVNFSPTLPPEKLDSINKLDMGLLNKVYYVFPKVFWDKDYDWIGHIPNEKGHWVYFANLYGVLKEPVLLAFNTGDFGHQLEDMSNDVIVAEGLSVLKTIYGENIPQPDYTYITKWASEKFSYGSYSFTAVGSTNDDFIELSKPVENRLLFAGEATEVNYPATVHGAYFSGMREANRINWLEGNHLSPKAQLDNWVLPTYVICTEGFELLIKADEESAACVSHSVKLALMARDWGHSSPYETSNSYED